jgi:hypothetical protein
MEGYSFANCTRNPKLIPQDKKNLKESEGFLVTGENVILPVIINPNNFWMDSNPELDFKMELGCDFPEPIGVKAKEETKLNLNELTHCFLVQDKNVKVFQKKVNIEFLVPKLKDLQALQDFQFRNLFEFQEEKPIFEITDLFTLQLEKTTIILKLDKNNPDQGTVFSTSEISIPTIGFFENQELIKIS